MNINIQNGDCLELMKNIPDGSVDCIITDPPYFEIKGDFDFVFKSFDEYLEWVKLLAVEFKRILKPNGSLLWFGDDKNIAYCQVIFDKHFNFLNHLVWDKIHPICQGEANFRKFATRTERILYYANTRSKTGLEEIKEDVNNFKSLRDYFERVQKFIGTGKNTIIEKIGQKADHCFRHSSTQWDLPTPETYKELIDVFGIDKMEGFREYEVLRQEYEVLRQEYEVLRRPFNYKKGVYEVIRHLSDAQTIGKNEYHITQKPVFLIQKLIEITTNPNQTTLDPFMGSGTTGIACVNLDRNFIGFELDQDYFQIAEARIDQAQTQKDLILI